MARRMWKAVAFMVLIAVLAGISYGSWVAYDGAFDDVTVAHHTIATHSLGWTDQGGAVRARVVVDEGTVKVLEGRELTMQLLDSENRARLEQGRGYTPLEELVIDTRTEDAGSITYTAHTADTYYLCMRNEDAYDLQLRVADGTALDHQMFVKLFGVCLFAASIVIFCLLYGRLFDVPVRSILGLQRRSRGPGSRSAREVESPPEDIIGEGP